MIAVEVKCRSPLTGNRSPRSFRLHQHTIQILEVMDQWLGLDHRYFKVRAGDEAIYILRHDLLLNIWEIIFYEKDTSVSV